MTTTVKIDLFSPRWGHTDEYKIVLEENIMTISMSARKATCEFDSEENYIWSKDLGSDALFKILDNDSICYPRNLKSSLVKIWRTWVSGKLSDIEIQDKFKELETTINTTTKNNS
ncbi:hypothetical protein [Halarcobacter ebronensis]|uniref:Integron cassette protein domain-containing protein n=1 Tax=Halarcobacter ebronensis TaxID=1462615 RepID=A0A4Q1AV63_9BACT|nr:hypothetical protein [Halarcobacter ebronensis]QKF80762.1 hypothetical protein AEBR_0246 [Halarcobacter ebronensis]RXK08555.1 hypothetical protein CRV07_01775 [Halarcobacter ebronensis]